MRKDLQAWINETVIKDEMLWKRSAENQVLFLRDKIPSALCIDYEDFKKTKEGIIDISIHISKSIVLPVYEIKWNGWTFIMRDNFYDWKVSIIVPKNHKEQDIKNIDFMEIFDKNLKIHSVYCEGFDDNWVFPPIEKSPMEFTIEIRNEYKLYMFFWIIKNFDQK